MSVCVKVWHSEEPKPEGLFNPETFPDAPPNWFRESPEYAAELFALELGRDCRVSVVDDQEVLHEFDVQVRRCLTARVKRAP